MKNTREPPQNTTEQIKQELEELRSEMLKNFQTWNYEQMHTALTRAHQLNKLLYDQHKREHND